MPSLLLFPLALLEFCLSKFMNDRYRTGSMSSSNLAAALVEGYILFVWLFWKNCERLIGRPLGDWQIFFSSSFRHHQQQDRIPFLHYMRIFLFHSWKLNDHKNADFLPEQTLDKRWRTLLDGTNTRPCFVPRFDTFFTGGCSNADFAVVFSCRFIGPLLMDPYHQSFLTALGKYCTARHLTAKRVRRDGLNRRTGGTLRHVFQKRKLKRITQFCCCSIYL